MARPSPCPPELRERAVRMVAEIRPNYPTEWAAMKAAAARSSASLTTGHGPMS
jgi:transposase